MKTLIFEGCGWSQVESSDIGNCCARTRFVNENGSLIYLEIHGLPETKHTKRPFPLTGYAEQCFEEPDQQTSAFRRFEHKPFKYDAKSLLEFVNNNLSCSFDTVKVFNDVDWCVHDNDLPLCDSRKQD